MSQTPAGFGEFGKSTDSHKYAILVNLVSVVNLVNLPNLVIFGNSVFSVFC